MADDLAITRGELLGRQSAAAAFRNSVPSSANSDRSFSTSFAQAVASAWTSPRAALLACPYVLSHPAAFSCRDTLLFQGSRALSLSPSYGLTTALRLARVLRPLQRTLNQCCVE